jgi:hypothetical protein
MDDREHLTGARFRGRDERIAGQRHMVAVRMAAKQVDAREVGDKA